MRFQGQFHWTDFVASSLLHRRLTGLGRFLPHVFSVFIALAMLWALLLASPGRFPRFFFWMVVITVFVLVNRALDRYIWWPRQIRSFFAQDKEVNLPLEYEVTEVGMRGTNELGSILRPWNHYIKWKEGKDCILLYTSDGCFKILPRRFFTDPQQAESIKRYLVENNVPPARDPDMAEITTVILALMIPFMVLIGLIILFGRQWAS